MATTVSVTRTNTIDEGGIRDAVFQALDLVGLEPSGPVETVAIKPNLRFYWDYSTGETTDPRVVASVIDYVRERWNARARIAVVEADASAMRTRHAFPMLHYDRLASEKGVELVNLSDGEVCEKEVAVGGHKFTFPLPRMLLDADLFINCPKFKVGPYASGNALHITCSLKNLFGCISKPRKVGWHPQINEVIAGLNKLIRPHLNVVDGIVALGQRPVKLGLVVAGRDPVAVDSVVARMMRYRPSSVRQIRLAEKEGVGSAHNISVVGEDVKAISKLFPSRSPLAFKLTWSGQLWMLRLYAKLSGDAVPPLLD
jgi:uncharacterized protein (DUF362 family)